MFLEVYYSKFLLTTRLLQDIMNKLLTTIKALIDGRASIDFVGKVSISRTPGDVTDVCHN